MKTPPEKVVYKASEVLVKKNASGNLAYMQVYVVTFPAYDPDKFFTTTSRWRRLANGQLSIAHTHSEPKWAVPKMDENGKFITSKQHALIKLAREVQFKKMRGWLTTMDFYEETSRPW